MGNALILVLVLVLISLLVYYLKRGTKKEELQRAKLELAELRKRELGPISMNEIEIIWAEQQRIMNHIDRLEKEIKK